MPASKRASLSIPSGVVNRTSKGRSRTLIASEGAIGPETAPTGELFSNPRHPYTQGLLRAVPRLAEHRRTKAAAVVGDPPSPINVPSGCRFHPRCPIAQEPLCSSEDPALAGPHDHLAACHFAWTEQPPAHMPEVVEEQLG